MKEAEDLVADVIAAAGGRVVGRVRLQKMFYLLDQLGLKSGVEYDYHHYGPFSEELASAVVDATAFKLVKESIERRSDGVAYSVYSTDGEMPDQIGDMPATHGRAALDGMQRCSSTVLELAATIHWLRKVEKIDDWRAELRRRKGVKTEGGRMDAALKLLSELEIYPTG